MTTEKPSRNEDEYFVKQDAELLRKQRARRRSRRGGSRAEEPLHEVPQGRVRPDQQHVPRRPDRDLPPLRRDVARRRRGRGRGPRAPPRAAHPRDLRRASAASSGCGTGTSGDAAPPSPGAAEAFSFPGERPVTPEVVREHNLNELEYGRILELLGRTPTLTELGVFSRALVGALLVQALQAGAQDASPPPARRWSRARARTPASSACPTAGRWRSRSSRTTIRRRSSRTRARPPAWAASCATSSPWAPGRSRCSTACGSARSTHPRNRYLFAGVVRGVGDYGNCVGIPTLGGEVGFAPGYTGNPLVNAMCVGLLKEADLIRAAAQGVGNVLLCVGARTGRDGIHGASFASEELSREERGPPAAGPGGRPVHREAAARGQPRAHHLGAHRRHPGHGRRGAHQLERRDGGAGRRRRRDRHRPGAHPRGGHDAVRDPAVGVAGADAGRGRARPGGRDPGGLRQVGAGRDADRPGDRRRHLPGAAPRARGRRDSRASGWWTTARSTIPRPAKARRRAPGARARRRAAGQADLEGRSSCCSTPPTSRASAGCTSSTIRPCRPSTVLGPGGDAGVLRVPGHRRSASPSRWTATTGSSRSTRTRAARPPWPRRPGTSPAPARVPLGITDCLNFGNPEKPEVFFQFREACRGIADACRAFDTPVTGGNVCFYNESPTGAVDPTPTVGMVGLLEQVDAPRAEPLLRARRRDPGAGRHPRRARAARPTGRRCTTSSAAGRRGSTSTPSGGCSGCWWRRPARLLRSAHDCSEGGLAVALAEAAMGGPYAPAASAPRSTCRRAPRRGARGRPVRRGWRPGRRLVRARARRRAGRRWPTSTACRCIGSAGSASARRRLELRVAAQLFTWSIECIAADLLRGDSPPDAASGRGPLGGRVRHVRHHRRLRDP